MPENCHKTVILCSGSLWLKEKEDGPRVLSGGRVTQHRGHPCAPGRTRALSPSAPAPRAGRACPRPASAATSWATRQPVAWRVPALPGAPSSTWDLPTPAGAHPPDGSRSSDPGLLVDSLAAPRNTSCEGRSVHPVPEAICHPPVSSAEFATSSGFWCRTDRL